MAHLKLMVFGPPRLQRDGKTLELNLRRALALLVYLAVTGKPQSRDALATMLWPESDQSEARGRLRRTLHRLNETLGEGILDVGPDTICLYSAADLWLDSAAFRQHVTAGLPAAPADALAPARLAHLTAAVELYADDFLAGFTLPDSPAFDEWQFFVRETLRQLYGQALEQLVMAYRSRSAWEQAITYARKWVALDGLHEPAHRALMRLYAWAGQHAAALRQYQECARILDAELGVAPEDETSALYEAIRTRQIAPPFAAEHPSAPRRAVVELEPHSRSVPEELPATAGQSEPYHGHHKEQQIRAHNLPAQSTPFIGRDQELAEVRQLLDEPICRLVTLVGPGGMGKTRLALATAEALVRTGSPLADGVFFVSLAPLSAVADILPTIANALGFSFYADPSPLEQLLDFLRPKRMLLVLDNFEHLLRDESATLVNTILTAAPQVKLLVTSRVRLNVQGEHGFVVAGMEVPELPPGRRDIAEGYSAMQLFQQSARRARPDFVLTPDDLRAVARICRLVHGMPLGIELAAAWMEMLSPAEIAAEIEQSLDFLETEWRNIPERQHSLRAVFDASWKLLDDHERSALEALTVFQGAFAREAAQYVAGASLKTLRALVNQSWLQPEGGRFKIHDLLRQYAAEKLQADPSAWRRSRERHSAYFVDLLGQLDGPMNGAQPRAAFDALTADLDNIRAAWHWLIEQGQFDRVIQQMLPVLFRYCDVQFKAFVLLSLLETAQQAVSASDDANDRFHLAILLTVRGAFLRNGAPLRAHWWGQFYDDAIKQAWSMAGTSESLRAMGFWGVLLAAIYGLTNNTVEGIHQLRGLLPDLRQAGQPATLAFALQSLGHLPSLQLPDEAPDQPLAEAAQHLTEALAIFGALGDEQESGNTLRLRAIIRLLQQRLAEARDDLQAAQAKFERVGDWATAAGTNWHLADVHFQLGDIEAAFRYLRQMSQTFAQRGHPIAAAVGLSRESYEALRYSSIDHARQTREQSLALARENGDVFGEAWYLWEMGEIERFGGDYAAARQWYEQARELFEKLGVKRELGFYHRGLGDIAQALGDYAEARRQFQESLTVARQTAHDWAAAYALAGLARAALALGEHEATQGYLLEALQKARKIADSGIMMVVLAGAAGLYAARGDRERAVELGTLVVDHYAAWRETKAQAAAVIQAAAAVLPPDRLARSQERGRGRDIWETAAQLVRDLS